MIALAKKRKRVLTVYQNRRWDGDFKTVKKIVESGVLGRVVEYEERFERFRPNYGRETGGKKTNRRIPCCWNWGRIWWIRR